MRLLLWILPPLIFIACAHRDVRLCDNIVMREGRLKLSRNEKVLVCGSDAGGKGWENVPVPQAQYHIGVFLEREGYLKPHFKRDKEILEVWSGPQTEIQTLEVRGADGLLNSAKKRQVEGEALTPAKLDEVEQWADTGLRTQGYACPDVDIKAQAWDRRVIAYVKPGARQRIASVTRVGIDGIKEEALERYQAFDLGDTYDVLETQLTISRMLADSLIQSAYFTTKCEGSEAHLQLKGSVGPPRLVKFEIGASTEEFPFGVLTFKNARLDSEASSFTTILRGSPREQSLTATSQLYWLPGTDRTFFGPRAQLARFDERTFEYFRAKAGADIGRHWDMWHTRLSGRFGPMMNYVKTLEGVGPEDISYLSWEGSLQAMSHNYEAYLRNQYEGWEALFNYRGQRKGVGAEINVDRYDFSYKKLWNIGGYAPPLFVLGTRLEMTGVNADRIVSVADGDKILPLEYRVFLGGADNLRGFSRKSIANRGLGYLTSVYGGLELRLVEELPWNIQPLVLFDIAQLGTGEFTLDEPLFTSSGAGVRWASPFGTIRGSAARGRIFNGDVTTEEYKQEWVFYFSFGQEF